MIRFGAVLSVVVIAFGLLAAGFAAGSLLLVAISIGVAALAFLMLVAVVVSLRHEIFGARPTPAADPKSEAEHPQPALPAGAKIRAGQVPADAKLAQESGAAGRPGAGNGKPTPAAPAPSASPERPRSEAPWPKADRPAPARAEPARAEPARAEPVPRQPARAEAASPEPPGPPNQAGRPEGPTQAEQRRSEPPKPDARPESTQPEPAQPKPAQPKPAQPKPAQPKPAQPKPPQPEPTRPEATRPEPAQPQPAQPQPARSDNAARPEQAEVEPDAAKPGTPDPVASAAAGPAASSGGHGTGETQPEPSQHLSWRERRAARKLATRQQSDGADRDHPASEPKQTEQPSRPADQESDVAAPEDTSAKPAADAPGPDEPRSDNPGLDKPSPGRGSESADAGQPSRPSKLERESRRAVGAATGRSGAERGQTAPSQAAVVGRTAPTAKAGTAAAIEPGGENAPATAPARADKPISENAEAAGKADKAGADAGSPAASAAGAKDDMQVAVVPGITRYHRSDCLLIRFLTDDDLELMSRQQAKDGGCVPCKACKPDQETASAAVG